MPNAGPHRVLRATKGCRGTAQTGEGVPVFNYGPGDDQGPALVGNRYFNLASQLVPILTLGGTTLLEGNIDAPNFRAYEPDRPWGKRGTLIRTPRVAVLVVPGLATGVEPDTFEQPILWANDFANAVSGAAAVGRLTDAGVSVYVVRPVDNHLAINAAPLVGPCVIENAAQTLADFDPAFGPFANANPLTNTVAAVGGDVWWGWVGSRYASDFGAYTSFGISTSTVTDPGGAEDPGPYPFITDGLVVIGSAHAFETTSPTEGAASDAIVALWPTSFDSDAGQLAAVAARCRSFRFAWVTQDTPVAAGPAVVTPDNSLVTSRVPAAANLGLVTSASAEAAAAAVLADMLAFFGL